MASKLVKIRLSLKGRPLKTYKFDKQTITVGRSPDADIVLENPGISREHCKLEMTARGYYVVEDLGSANGTFLNDERVDREYLMNNDVVRVGKFAMWANYEEDKRHETAAADKFASPQAFEGTTVLSMNELEEMMTTSKRETAPPMEAPTPIEAVRPATKPVPAPVKRPMADMLAMGIIVFVVGALFGGVVVWFFLGR